MTCAMGLAPDRAETRSGSGATPRRPGDARSAAGALTPREQQVASLISYGLTNKEIARELNISPATVKTRVHAILGQLGVTRRSAVARVMEKNV